MDTGATTTDSTPVTTHKPTEPVKIKKEVPDPDYKSANVAFDVTTQILASAIKSETEIKEEIKEEPMDASESDNHKPKLPLPILVKKKEKTNMQTRSTGPPLRSVGIQKTKVKGKKKRTLIYEPASNSGYYPPASVIWQRVPYLKPNRTRSHPKYKKWNPACYKKRPHYNMTLNQPQSNTDQSLNQSFLDNEENSPSDDNIDNENPPSNSTDTSDRGYFFMNLRNFPTTWTEIQIKEFLEKEYEPVQEIEMLKDEESNFNGEILIEFVTFEQRAKAVKRLNGKIIEGKSLSVAINDASDYSDSVSECSEPRIKKTKMKIESSYRPDIDVWEKDPKGLYGLKPEFLQSLGITPPIDRWVQVTNFRCDKSELKEVMELAGQVLLCTVLTINHKTAKVMYSHPLEAVQAVSMLHNQSFYGQSLNVTMERCLDRHIILPKGLQAVGPGLGQSGITLRDIVRHYERYAKGRSSSINSNIFREISFQMDSSHSNIKSSFSDLESVKTEPKLGNSQNVGPLVPNPCNPLINPIGPMPGPSGSIPETSGPMNGSSGQIPGPSGPILGPNGPLPGPSGPMPGHIGQTPGPSGQMSGPSGPMLGPNGHMPVSGGPCNQMRPNISGPMPYLTNQTRPGFCPNQVQAQMMGQGSTNPRQVGPIPNQIGQIPGQFKRMGPPGSLPVQTQTPGRLPGAMPHQQNMPGYTRQPGPMGSRGPSQGHNRPARTMNSANCPGPIPQSQENCTLEISNIPPNTPFPFLSEKLSMCGQLMSLQITRDRAVVQFATRGHAENCYKNNSTN